MSLFSVRHKIARAGPSSPTPGRVCLPGWVVAPALLFAWFVGQSAFGQAIEFGEPQGSAGATTIPIHFDGGSTSSVAAMQFDLAFDASRYELVDVRAAQSLSDGGKGVYASEGSDGNVRLVVTGLNTSTVPNGPLGEVTLRPAGNDAGPLSVSMSDPVFSDAQGNRLESARVGAEIEIGARPSQGNQAEEGQGRKSASSRSGQKAPRSHFSRPVELPPSLSGARQGTSSTGEPSAGDKEPANSSTPGSIWTTSQPPSAKDDGRDHRGSNSTKPGERQTAGGDLLRIGQTTRGGDEGVERWRSGGDREVYAWLDDRDSPLQSHSGDASEGRTAAPRNDGGSSRQPTDRRTVRFVMVGVASVLLFSITLGVRELLR